ncbi:MAG: trigger factor [Brotaphodocola sp.]
MKVEKKETEHYLLSVTLKADKEEFRAARQKAYLDHTDVYVVPGVLAGLATLEDLIKVYGPAVLYDEGLDLLIPEYLNRFLEQEKIRIVGKPEVKEISYGEDGGVTFRIEADMYPKIELGQYRNLVVPFPRSDVEHFERAVLQKACENIKGDVPKHMVEHKLNAMAAKEKLNVSRDAIYHLLADTIVVLEDAYKVVGVHRPFVQIREEALDMMLQTVSGDNKEVKKEFFIQLVRSYVERYHALDADFDHMVDEAIQRRMKKKASMTPDELTSEAFVAYLGSLGLDEKQWRKERETQAAKEVCYDLLLDEVAAREKITVSELELDAYLNQIAAQCQMELEEVRENIGDLSPIRWQMQRDKARTLILSSAEEGQANG